VTLRALKGDLRSALRVRLVAPDAGPLARHGMCGDDVPVTSLARLPAHRAHRMGLMTTNAVAMRSGDVLCQHLFVFVTRVTPEGRRWRKRVRPMAVGAGVMSAGERRGFRHHGVPRLVTLHAGGRLGGELVPAMATRARTAQALVSVLEVDLVVALIALTHRLCDWLVRIMASLAWHRVVHGEPFIGYGFEGSVATHAVPSAKHVRL